MASHGLGTNVSLASSVDSGLNPASGAPARVDRREFTLEAALALLSGIVITISGCETSDGPGTHG